MTADTIRSRGVDREALLAKYHKGMTGLGVGLLVLAALQAAIGVVCLRAGMAPPLLAVLVGMAAFHAVLGVLLLAKQRWANYPVLVWAVLLIAGNLVLMNLDTAEAKPTANSNPLGTLPQVIVIVVLAALLHSAGSNLAAWRKLRSATRDDR